MGEGTDRDTQEKGQMPMKADWRNITGWQTLGLVKTQEAESETRHGTPEDSPASTSPPAFWPPKTEGIEL